MADQIIHKKIKRYTTGDVDAQQIYLTNFAGEMSTISRSDSKIAGYPIGAVAPFMIDYTGCPVVYTASISERVKNVRENSKASLLIREIQRHHRIETGWRLALIGDLIEITESSDLERVRYRYFDHYPKASFYQNAKAHDFRFFRFDIKLARVILGFGRIAWVEGDVLKRPSILDAITEQQIIDHMNSSHKDAMEIYLVNEGIKLLTGVKPKMVAVNQFGITLRYHNRLYFIAFKNEVLNKQDIRAELVRMAKS